MYRESSFVVSLNRKYAVPWLESKGWKYHDRSGMIDPKTNKYLVLDQAVEMQMIRETP